MKWTEPTVEDIATKEVIFYSPRYEKVCTRICTDIGIDVFPDIDAQHYWKLERDEWKKCHISGDQALSETEPVFSQNVLDKLKAAPSNILLLKNESHSIAGILHFFDFHCLAVYRSLYHNFFQFENSLRTYLSLLGLSYKDVEAYYVNKSQQSKKPVSHDESRLERIRSKAFKDEVAQLGNLQGLGFKELVCFAISSFHKTTGDRPKPALKGIKEPEISRLRNTVMHAKNNIGASSMTLHNIEEFRKFFEQVLAFKEGFYLLMRQFDNLSAQAAERKNERKLEIIGKLDKKELIEYFLKPW